MPTPQANRTHNLPHLNNNNSRTADSSAEYNPSFGQKFSGEMSHTMRTLFTKEKDQKKTPAAQFAKESEGIMANIFGAQPGAETHTLDIIGGSAKLPGKFINLTAQHAEKKSEQLKEKGYNKTANVVKLGSKAIGVGGKVAEGGGKVVGAYAYANKLAIHAAQFACREPQFNPGDPEKVIKELSGTIEAAWKDVKAGCDTFKKEYKEKPKKIYNSMSEQTKDLLSKDKSGELREFLSQKENAKQIVENPEAINRLCADWRDQHMKKNLEKKVSDKPKTTALSLDDFDPSPSPKVNSNNKTLHINN